MYFEVKYIYELRFLVLIKYNILKNVTKIKVSYLGGHYDQMVTDSKLPQGSCCVLLPCSF